MTLEIKNADELVDRELEARWAARRADRHGDVLQHILRRFIEREGPVPATDIHRAFPGRSVASVEQDLAALHDKDLIRLSDGYVRLAYPFSARPTAFTVTLADGRERYACCAIDALGIAPMLGQRIGIRSRCHHCSEPLEFRADPDGLTPEAAGVMVWVGKRGEAERRLSESL